MVCPLGASRSARQEMDCQATALNGDNGSGATKSDPAVAA
jgi:hypothetical protein